MFILGRNGCIINCDDVSAIEFRQRYNRASTLVARMKDGSEYALNECDGYSERMRGKPKRKFKNHADLMNYKRFIGEYWLKTIANGLDANVEVCNLTGEDFP